MFPFFYFLSIVVLVDAQDDPGCGPWSNWTGDCQTQYCGQCFSQTRSRENISNCAANLTDSRQCMNLACRLSAQGCCYSGNGCLPGCEWFQLNDTYYGGLYSGQARCKLPGTTLRVGIDDYQIWGNTTDTVFSTTCYTDPSSCGEWTEWSGSCDFDHCGQCRSQSRTRTNISNCTPLISTRQCMNLACRNSTQPNCFTGNGCPTGCAWLQLNLSYYNGRYNGQARCKLNGTTIKVGCDDYQIWMNTTQTVNTTTCYNGTDPTGSNG